MKKNIRSEPFFFLLFIEDILSTKNSLPVHFIWPTLQTVENRINTNLRWFIPVTCFELMNDLESKF